MDDTKYKSLNYLLLGMGIIASLGFITYASSGTDGLLNLYTLWTIFPFSILLLVTYRTTSRRTLVTTTILNVLCTFSIYLYFDSLFIRPDAQGALVFLFLPLYQLFATIAGFGILGVANFLKNRDFS